MTHGMKLIDNLSADATEWLLGIVTGLFPKQQLNQKLNFRHYVMLPRIFEKKYNLLKYYMVKRLFYPSKV